MSNILASWMKKLDKMQRNLVYSDDSVYIIDEMHTSLIYTQKIVGSSQIKFAIHLFLKHFIAE